MERKGNNRSEQTTMIIVDSKVFKMQIQPKAKDMMQEKTSGIKLHIGVDILGLPHSIMITTADVTEHNGAVDMVDYYCDDTDNLSHVKKILVD